ncbi:hypothetical protein LTR10_021272 [Elasticomyces elasticus]|uniref:BTB domain-containing protein n=1 Tax=Exophiala sideris TaxID=1016849 RepID=A0ABR0JFQ6_9EURO|nr:hypothetical protein LTR10_021272 [Elasticomyces elasticus]KAK5025385.1 hypothetical protein LTS07_008236 [Exophiala sideris]KAK5032960.1 hypothetical protein LTR13_006925 [Exophiala sideris]KAK5063445.1 hypothetical protein LTR69_004151 [Exophiala sideris]
MASSTPSCPKGQKDNKYARQTVHITVGRSKTSFHVHYSQLERTAFFEAHPMPAASNNGTPSREPSAGDDRERTLSPPPEIKSEDTSGEPEAETAAIFQDSPSRPLYHLEGFVYEPAAFEIVVNWMYNQPPGVPDAIIDCVRKYHQEYNVSFEYLTWLINRLGDGPDAHTIPMMRYLIDQIAFEISTQGFNEFSHDNPLFETFLIQSDRPIRKALFHALADIARALAGSIAPADRARLDPALGPNRWTVRHWKKPQREEGAAVDIIEVDE